MSHRRELAFLIFPAGEGGSRVENVAVLEKCRKLPKKGKKWGICGISHMWIDHFCLFLAIFGDFSKTMGGSPLFDH